MGSNEFTVLTAAVIFCAFAGWAYEQNKNFEIRMGEINDQFGGLAIGFVLFYFLCWSVGRALAIQTVINLIGLSTNAQDPNFKVSTAVITGIVGMSLIAIPDMVEIGHDNLFGPGSIFTNPVPQ